MNLLVCNLKHGEREFSYLFYLCLEEYVVFILSNWSFSQGTTSAPSKPSTSLEQEGMAEYFLFFNKCRFL